MTIEPAHYPLDVRRNRALKRSFDVAFSCLALLLSPLFFLPIALLVKLTSRGPVFFVQRRTGRNGVPFNCYKFRTMRVNNEADTVQATDDDPRITRVGHFLRRTSLDELPQFVNVLLGQMSVIGPRPHMLFHTSRYSSLVDDYNERLLVKPGITGWAQVKGLRGPTEELWKMQQRVSNDIWYVQNWSFALDLKILRLTLRNIMGRERNAV